MINERNGGGSGTIVNCNKGALKQATPVSNDARDNDDSNERSPVDAPARPPEPVVRGETEQTPTPDSDFKVNSARSKEPMTEVRTAESIKSTQDPCTQEIDVPVGVLTVQTKRDSILTKLPKAQAKKGEGPVVSFRAKVDSSDNSGRNMVAS
ncbi:unnamed protein product, partial [Mesorhabditis spiculigera]